MEAEKIVLTPERVRANASNLFLKEKVIVREEPSKIKFCSLAHDNSLVYIRNSANVDELVHVDNTNTVLWNKLFPESMKVAFMPSSQHLYAVNDDISTLYMCDLQSQRTKQVAFECHFPFKKQVSAFVFGSKFCLVGQFKLLQAPKNNVHSHLKVKTIKACFAYFNTSDGRFLKSKEDSGMYNLTKLNNVSKIGFFDRQFSLFLVMHLKDDQIRWKEYSITRQMEDTRVLDLWPLLELPSAYLFKAKVQKKKQSGIDWEEPHYNLYTLDTNSPKQLYSLKEYSLTFDNQQLDITKYDNIFFYGTGKTTIVYLRNTFGTGALLFLNPVSREVHCMKEMPDTFLSFTLPQWNNSILCVEDLQKLNKAKDGKVEMQLINFSLSNIKHIYGHMLDYLNEQFDDDLILDVVDLITQD